MSDFIQKFTEEGSFKLPEELAVHVLSLAKNVYLKPKEDLIQCGKTDSNIYIVEEGILRMRYFDGGG